MGNLVWARDDKTGEEGFKTVVETYVREADKLVHLTYQGEGGEATIVGTGSLCEAGFTQGSFASQTTRSGASRPRTGSTWAS